MITSGVDATIAHRAMLEHAIMRGVARRYGGSLGRGRNFQRRPSSAAPAGPLPFPDLATGVFDRDSAATYHNGSLATIAVALADVLRNEDRGDGAGPQSVFESSRENRCQYSKQINASGWTAGGTVALDQIAGPEGLTDADKLTNAGTGQTLCRVLYNAGSTAALQCGSIYVKQGTQGSIASIRTGSTGSTDLTPTASWARHQHLYSGSAASEFLIAWNHASGQTGSGTVGDNHYWTLAQLEVGVRYATSVIITNGSTQTRFADNLTFAQAAIPTWFYNAGWSTRVWPRFANTDLASGDIRVLYSAGDANNVLRVRHTGTDVRVELVQGGTVRASSLAITGKARHALWTIALDPVNARVTVDGANGSAGTAWSWSAADVRVGGIYGAANEADCRIEKPIAA